VQNRASRKLLQLTGGVMDPPTFTKIAKLVRCVLIHWTIVSFPSVSVLCNPSNDHTPFPTLWVKVLTVRTTMNLLMNCNRILHTEIIQTYVSAKSQKTQRGSVSFFSRFCIEAKSLITQTYFYQVLPGPFFQSHLSTLVESVVHIYMLISNSY